MGRFNVRGTDRLFEAIVYALLILGLIVIVLPISYVITTSFAPEKEFLTRGFFILPHHWTFEGYLYLLTTSQFRSAFRASVEITVAGTAINILLTSLMAYGLSKTQLKGRSLLNFMVVFTMLFQGGLIPTYLVVKNLGLINSYSAIWFSTAIAPFNLIIMRSFFSRIPRELLESARIDGCGEWRMLLQIVMPLSMAVIATFTLFYLVFNWNTYFQAILYIDDSTKWPLQVYLRQMLIQQSQEYTDDLSTSFHYTPASKMAAILLTAIPLLVVYPFLQKYFNKGVLLGSLKQ